MVQVRKFERHAVHLKVIYDDGVSWVSAFVDDASETGLMLEGPEPLPIGREVRLEPAGNQSDAWFELKGRVVRCYETGSTGSIDRWGTSPLFAIAIELTGVTPEQTLAIRDMLERADQSARERLAPTAL